MKISFKKKFDGVTKRMEELLKNAKDKDGFLKKYVYPEYKFVQKKRWMNENETPDVTGGRWDRLSPVYAKYKKRKYASYPGSGSRLLIAQYRLLPSVLGEHETSRVLIQNGKMSVSSSLPYADPVNKNRPFDTFSPVFKARIASSWAKYISGKKT